MPGQRSNLRWLIVLGQVALFAVAILLWQLYPGIAKIVLFSASSLAVIALVLAPIYLLRKNKAGDNPLEILAVGVMTILAAVFFFAFIFFSLDPFIQHPDKPQEVFRFVFNQAMRGFFDILEPFDIRFTTLEVDRTNQAAIWSLVAFRSFIEFVVVSSMTVSFQRWRRRRG